MENFKSMYPREIRVIQSYVSEVCDRMDYQNSPMYDEWPEQRTVDQMCDSVCESVSASQDMGLLRDAWGMQEEKTIERMSVEEKQEERVLNPEKGELEKGTDREKEKVKTEELNDEKNNLDERRMEDIKEGAEDEKIEEPEPKAEEKEIHTEKNAEKVKIQEHKNLMERGMEENIHQVTAEAGLRENNRITESREMRPPLRHWWNEWEVDGIGTDVQGRAWGMEPAYALPDPVEAENDPGLREQELKRPPHIPGLIWPPHPPQGSGPVRPPYPPQGPNPVWPPYPPQSSGPMRPPYPPQGPGPVRPPYPPQGPGPVRPPYPPQGSGPVRPPYPPQEPNPVWPPYPPQGSGPVRPPYPPQGPGPVRPPYPPQEPNPVWPPNLPQGPNPPQSSGPVRPPYPPQGPGPMRPPYPPHRPNPPRPPRPGIYPVWFRDIVKTLILDEMQNRRCRRGMCIG